MLLHKASFQRQLPKKLIIFKCEAFYRILIFKVQITCSGASNDKIPLLIDVRLIPIAMPIGAPIENTSIAATKLNAWYPDEDNSIPRQNASTSLCALTAPNTNKT